MCRAMTCVLFQHRQDNSQSGAWPTSQIQLLESDMFITLNKRLNMVIYLPNEHQVKATNVGFRFLRQE